MSMSQLWGNIRFIGRLFCILVKHIFCAALLLSACSGCMNLWTRNPFTDTRIERCYQSTSTMAGGALIVAFPQMMSDNPGDGGFMWENCFTIPFMGLPCAVDAVCEACIDTVCLPVDWPLAASRREGK